MAWLKLFGTRVSDPSPSNLKRTESSATRSHSAKVAFGSAVVIASLTMTVISLIWAVGPKEYYLDAVDFPPPVYFLPYVSGTTDLQFRTYQALAEQRRTAATESDLAASGVLQTVHEQNRHWLLCRESFDLRLALCSCWTRPCTPIPRPHVKRPRVLEHGLVGLSPHVGGYGNDRFVRAHINL